MSHYSLKESLKAPEKLLGGHRMCAGCGAPIVVRAVLRGLGANDHAVVCSATGCLQVSSCLFPYTSWNCSFIHTAFENAAATISGAEGAYNAICRKNDIVKNSFEENDSEAKFIAFGGDGGSYDIGLQSLSGAMERGHDITYVCYNNGAYMNTGIQKSSATPQFADTTTSPAGKKIGGKMTPMKDLTMIMASHDLPFVAQSAPFGNFSDLTQKAKKAIYTKGACFINVLAPCPRGWRYETPKLANIIKLAMDTLIWPIYEVENGKFKINYVPKTILPVEEFLKEQGRFKHMFKSENWWMIEKFQKYVNQKWERLNKLCEISG